MPGTTPCSLIMRTWHWDSLPTHKRNDSSGAFSFARAHSPGDKEEATVIVGGDFKLPDDSTDTAWLLDSHGKIALAQTPPHGYRSAVAYDSTSKTWITVGPNGTDISRDDGKNWTALKPTASDPSDSDKSWNALSLPFVVGPNGRIGKLRPEALIPKP